MPIWLREKLFQKKFLFDKLKNQDIILSKNEKIYLEDAQYFIEDVRKNVIENFTYDKVYKQGFNINTPINLQFQKFLIIILKHASPFYLINQIFGVYSLYHLQL